MVSLRISNFLLLVLDSKFQAPSVEPAATVFAFADARSFTTTILQDVSDLKLLQLKWRTIKKVLNISKYQLKWFGPIVIYFDFESVMKAVDSC